LLSSPLTLQNFLQQFVILSEDTSQWLSGDTQITADIPGGAGFRKRKFENSSGSDIFSEYGVPVLAPVPGQINITQIDVNNHF
jgi:hypothetical protein